uniref:Uncharacterized protein n=1 Tax=Chromera velia CCMP2878 TaxID=1169474 RepID=A0A0G4FJ65_9ALVE|eukprot:Cvel_17322.t1-p1 / transcript=Cvel_17322.t1 / gene=Cvel_17322 / organism=Chromera_velia_CCMP2878 / gene_product=Uncharacterized protein MAL13P1.147, putative / transcript_product=Uncharacterized protein MAL13P1.147, putative / location=Cvel_scaffold1375:47763-48640(-) / protein_length=253 / sequence_SO=supercontig / SO=protein_coding / is_pseudo=false
MWKRFGRDTEAGRLLYSLYKTKHAPKINYPLIKTIHKDMNAQQQQSEKPKKPCPQRAVVDVPKVGRPKKAAVPQTASKKKALETILKETKGYHNKADRPLPGRNQDTEKDRLAFQFQFSKCTAMPKEARVPTLSAYDRPMLIDNGKLARKIVENRYEREQNREARIAEEHRRMREELQEEVCHKEALLEHLQQYPSTLQEAMPYAKGHGRAGPKPLHAVQMMNGQMKLELEACRDMKEAQEDLTRLENLISMQ